MAAALAAGRSSLGVERLDALQPRIAAQLEEAVGEGRRRARERLRSHEELMNRRAAAGKTASHRSTVYGLSVITGQERELCLLEPAALRSTGPGRWVASHAPLAATAG